MSEDKMVSVSSALLNEARQAITTIAEVKKQEREAVNAG